MRRNEVLPVMQQHTVHLYERGHSQNEQRRRNNATAYLKQNGSLECKAAETCWKLTSSKKARCTSSGQSACTMSTGCSRERQSSMISGSRLALRAPLSSDKLESRPCSKSPNTTESGSKTTHAYGHVSQQALRFVYACILVPQVGLCTYEKVAKD